MCQDPDPDPVRILAKNEDPDPDRIQGYFYRILHVTPEHAQTLIFIKLNADQFFKYFFLKKFDCSTIIKIILNEIL